MQLSYVVETMRPTIDSQEEPDPRIVAFLKGVNGHSADDYDASFEDLKDRISSVLIKLYDTHSMEEIEQMGGAIAAKLGVDANSIKFKRAFAVCLAGEQPYDESDVVAEHFADPRDGRVEREDPQRAVAMRLARKRVRLQKQLSELVDALANFPDNDQTEEGAQARDELLYDIHDLQRDIEVIKGKERAALLGEPEPQITRESVIIPRDDTLEEGRDKAAILRDIASTRDELRALKSRAASVEQSGVSHQYDAQVERLNNRMIALQQDLRAAENAPGIEADQRAAARRISDAKAAAVQTTDVKSARGSAISAGFAKWAELRDQYKGNDGLNRAIKAAALAQTEHGKHRLDVDKLAKEFGVPTRTMYRRLEVPALMSVRMLMPINSGRS